MKTLNVVLLATVAFILPFGIAACSDDSGSPVSPSAVPAPSPAAPGALGAFPPADAVQPVNAPVVPPPMQFTLPDVPPGWNEPVVAPVSPVRYARNYTGLRVQTTDDLYPWRIDQGDSEKMEAILAYSDDGGPVREVVTGANWRVSNAHVASVSEHGNVYGRNPGKVDVIASTRGREGRRTGIAVHPGPSREFRDRFWSQLIYDRLDEPNPTYDDYVYVLEDPSPDIYLLFEPGTQNTGHWLSWSQRNLPNAVESLTGQPYTGRIHGGSADIRQQGTITVVFDLPPYERDLEDICGRAYVGSASFDDGGRAWLRLGNDGRPYSTCNYYSYDFYHTFLHEIGHSFGLLHVDDRNSIMAGNADGYRLSTRTHLSFSSTEQYHSRLAYRVGRGWFDYCGWPFLVRCETDPFNRAEPPRMIVP